MTALFTKKQSGSKVRCEGNALTAEMGKVLGNEVDTLKGIIKFQNNAEDASGKYIYKNGAIYDGSGWSVSREISLNAGETINVTVSTLNTNSIVIGRVKNSTSCYTGDAVFPTTGQTNYSYTATADCTVKITYKTSEGFSAYVDKGNPTEKVDVKVETILSRLGGTMIPFDQPKTYTFVNGSLVENTGSLTTGCSTAKLNIADYKALFYSGCRTTFDGYFCAVFFDDNDNYVGWGLRPHDERSDTTLVTHTVTYDMVNVLAEVPSGATKVVLQTDKHATPNSAVIAFAEMPYNFLQEEDWRQAYYGIVGDGVTDDTNALQALLDNSRGEVSLRAGSYLITSPLVVNATKLHRIKGNGATLKVSGDIVAFDIYGNTTDDVTPDVEGDWRISHAGFTLEGMRITALNGTQGIGVSLTNCLKPTIKNCYIWHIKDGIVMHLNRDVIIEGCNIYQCTESGILFASDASVHQANINGNHISWCRNCILFDDALQINNIQFSGNDIEAGNSYPSVGDNCCIRMTNTNPTLVGEVEFVGNTIQGHTGSSSIINISGDPSKPLKPAYGMSFVGNFMSGCDNNYFELAYIQNITIANNIIKGVSNSFVNLSGNIELLSVVGNVMNTLETTGKALLTTANDAVLNNISINGNIGNPASITISGASQDYISVVGNNLGGGTVTIGTATHKQEANNI